MAVTMVDMFQCLPVQDLLCLLPRKPNKMWRDPVQKAKADI